MDQKMPYEKPSLETIDVKTLTEAVGPVQALSSGISTEPTVAPQQLASGGNRGLKRR